MRRVEIRYLETVSSAAMNKSPNQSGIILTETTSYRTNVPIVKINAINPKTNRETSYLEMQIPKAHIQQVIDVLKQMI